MANPTTAEFAGGITETGCGLQEAGQRKVGGQPVEVPEKCEGWLSEWVEFARVSRPDIAWVQLGAWEVADFRPTKTGSFTSLIDDATRDQLSAELDSLVAELLQWGTSVALVLPADVGAGHPARGKHPETDPERMQLWRDTTRSVAEQHAGAFTVDFSGWVETQDDANLRPDGVHLSMTTSRMAAEGLLPQVVDLVRLPSSESDWRSGGILLAGDQLARPLAAKLTATATVDSSPSIAYVHLPTLPRGDEAQRSWETLLATAVPQAVVVILEHWEVVLTLSESDRDT